jgi:hypothetical protein
MSNIMHNFFNPPGEIKPGQIWHSNELGQNLLITDVDKDYSKIGVYRAMVIKKSDHLSDNHDVRFELDKMLAMALGKENVTLRITDGPVCKEDLSFYCGDVDSKYLPQIRDALNAEKGYTDSQIYVLEDYFYGLQSLREKALRKVDEAGKQFVDSLPVVSILDKLTTSSYEKFYEYLMVASDGSAEAGEEKFWEVEEECVDRFKVSGESEEVAVYLSVVDKVLYFLCFTYLHRKIENIVLNNGYNQIEAANESISVGSDHRVFSGFKNVEELNEGIWELSFNADGNRMVYAFKIE